MDDSKTKGQQPKGEAAITGENPKNVVNSVAKAFSVLHAFSAEEPAMTISEVAVAADLDRGTAYRLIHTLVALGYLRAVPNKRFRLALKCLELGFLVLSTQDVAQHASPLLQECVPRISDAASVGILDGADVVFMQRVEQGLARHVDRRPGKRIPAYASALGQAMLAFLPREQQIAILDSSPRVKLSERTLTDLDDLLDRLVLVREQGYAVSEGENAYGLCTVAVPVLNSAGEPVAGVSLTVNAERMSAAELVSSALPSAREIAQELASTLHFSAGALKLPTAN
ncbi:IclR family transcriptional regulator domain-containing protein [Pseudomonas sp. TH31]|uniref:IclR family transcriptional regulator domain-containing protein n=1 Tax=Pseudomonas sp. TH31 TaxID=2796396 RepID=UPI00191139F8|nr:helix-turn-helix domain-containing protein [Pseudomonas sp. TH31]